MIELAFAENSRKHLAKGDPTHQQQKSIVTLFVLLDFLPMRYRVFERMHHEVWVHLMAWMAGFHKVLDVDGCVVLVEVAGRMPIAGGHWVAISGNIAMTLIHFHER